MPEMTKNDLKFLMNALWGSLQSNDWSSLGDLKVMRDALQSGKTLKELDQKTFDRIFPSLLKITTHLGGQIAESIQENMTIVEKLNEEPSASAIPDPVIAETATVVPEIVEKTP